MSEARMFPIQRSYARYGEDDIEPHPMKIPWSVADKAYSVYSARYGTGQSLERLAERGGFSAGEMDMFLPGWRKEVSRIAEQDAIIKELVEALEEVHHGDLSLATQALIAEIKTEEKCSLCNRTGRHWHATKAGVMVPCSRCIPGATKASSG